MRVVGLDLSLTSTGIALEGGTAVIDPAPRRGMDRIMWIRDRVLGYVSNEVYCDSNLPLDHLVVIEDYAFSRGNRAHELGELGGVVKAAMLDVGYSFVVVNPKHLKMYALGKGGGKGTDKAAMRIAAFKRFGIEFLTDDECDAYWLRTMGVDAMGDGTMIADLPPSHRKVLSDIDWPTAVAS